MISQQEAIDIAKDLKRLRDIKPVYSAGGWRVDKQTYEMMGYYNANRKELTLPGYILALQPMSINCNPCIGKVVSVLLSLEPKQENN